MKKINLKNLNIKSLNIKELITKYKQREKKPPKMTTTPVWLTALTMLALSFVLTVIIELFNHKGFSGFFLFAGERTTAFLVNFLICLVLLAPTFFFKRRLFYAVIVGFFLLLGGVANGVIILNRMTPFTTADLAIVASGFEVIQRYLSNLWLVILALTVIGLIAGLTYLFVRGPRTAMQFKKRLICGVCAVAVSAASLVGAINMGFSNGALSNIFANLADAYYNYGFSYCFFNTWLNTGVKRPVDYSREKIDEIVQNVRDAQEFSNPRTNVNVIYVQLESFYDPENIVGLSLSADPLETWHLLKVTNSHGLLTVPVAGAGTANTEFEVLTGMSVRSFGPGEYPYKTVLADNTVESAAYLLKDLGYSTHAIHNHRGAFYSRNKVYANLGFDTFTSLEYMQHIELTPKNWAKDSVLTSEIFLALDSTEEKDFVFTVSVQGHGKYPSEPVIENPKVRVLNIANESERYSVEYYVNQLYETDMFIKDLTNALSRRNERTIVVFYSDHIPSLGLTADNITTGDIFTTEYLIWSNFRIKTEYKDLTSYQLSAAALDKIGLRSGVVNAFEQTMTESETYQSDLEALQYDMLYGQHYAYDDTVGYLPTEMKMGVAPITVTGVSKGEGYIHIYGENFTKYCKVTVNSEVVKTKFINNHILEINPNSHVNSIDDVKISVVEKYKEILSVTE